MNIDAAGSRDGPGSKWMARKNRAGADGGYNTEKIPPGLDAVFVPFRVVRMVIIFGRPIGSHRHGSMTKLKSRRQAFFTAQFGESLSSESVRSPLEVE